MGDEQATNSTEGQPQAGQKVDSPPVQEVVDLYKAHYPELEHWLEVVEGLFQKKRLPPETASAIYSVTGRMKDPKHLAEKILRKRAEDPTRVINRDTLFDEVDDLAGLRVVTLYRWDFKLVHEFIESQVGKWWKFACAPEAKCVYPEDFAQFCDMGLQPKRNDTYTSIHYILEHIGKTKVRCEVQVRSLHIEGWGEVDHALRYPSRSPGPITTEILRALHQSAAVTDWLAHLARSTDTLETRLTAREREIERLVGDLEAQSKRSTEVAQDNEELKRTVQELRSKVTSAVTYLSPTGAASSLWPAGEPWSTTVSYLPLSSYARRTDVEYEGTFSQILGPLNCQACGKFSAALETCASCGRSHCRDCTTDVLLFAASKDPKCKGCA